MYYMLSKNILPFHTPEIVLSSYKISYFWGVCDFEIVFIEVKNYLRTLRILPEIISSGSLDIEKKEDLSDPNFKCENNWFFLSIAKTELYDMYFIPGNWKFCHRGQNQ